MERSDHPRWEMETKLYIIRFYYVFSYSHFLNKNYKIEIIFNVGFESCYARFNINFPRFWIVEDSMKE